MSTLGRVASTGMADDGASVGADHNFLAKAPSLPEMSDERAGCGAFSSAAPRMTTMPMPEAKPSIIATTAMIRFGGGELRASGKSALEMMRMFLVSTCSCSLVSRARTRNCFVDGAVGLHLAIKLAQADQRRRWSLSRCS